MSEVRRHYEEASQMSHSYRDELEETKDRLRDALETVCTFYTIDIYVTPFLSLIIESLFYRTLWRANKVEYFKIKSSHLKSSNLKSFKRVMKAQV